MIFCQFLMVFLIVSSLTASATTVRKVKNQDRIEVAMSETDVNRIAMLNDRIKAIYGSQDKVHIVPDEENGQIFVTPRERGGESFGMSLVTESGATIDLKVKPVEMASETILLKLDKRTQAEIKRERSLKEKEVRNLIEAVLIGNSIKGYQMIAVTIQIKEDLVQKQVYTGSQYKALLLEYKNSKANNDLLSEETFKLSPNVIAVSIAKKSLKPGETTKIVVIEDVKR